MGMNKTIEVLPQSPFIGAMREQLGDALRVMFHHPYAIYYQVSGQEVIVVRVLHGARDAAALAEQGGFVH